VQLAGHVGFSSTVAISEGKQKANARVSSLETRAFLMLCFHVFVIELRHFVGRWLEV
jgi:hypothetical protein